MSVNKPERGVNPSRNEQRLGAGRIQFDEPGMRQLFAHAANVSEYMVPTVGRQIDGTPHLPFNRATGEIYLPYEFVAPNTHSVAEQAWFARLFPFDSVFIVKSLTASGQPENLDLARKQVENLTIEQATFGFIPNENDLTFLNRSQAPFLTTMIFDVYEAMEKQGDPTAKTWLEQQMYQAQDEYHSSWMITEQESQRRGRRNPNHRPSADLRLLRFSTRDVPGDHYGTAGESAFDENSGTAGRTGDFYHVLLDFAMWRYEKDFARAARILGKTEDDGFRSPAYWESEATARAKEIETFHWDEANGFYFHYDLALGQKNTSHYELTAYLPMFFDYFDPIADREKTDALVAQLKRFETPLGLMIGDKSSVVTGAQINQVLQAMEAAGIDTRWQPSVKDLLGRKQWDAPNMWAPMTYFTVAGLLKYGYVEDATRIMEKSLRSYAYYLEKHGTLPEKMRIDEDVPQDGENFKYPDQKGFAWTNAVVMLFKYMLEDIYAQRAQAA
ncbi:MAG: hypothetical protein KGL95_11885 [Patescibacteria group bacterium]|nr:hypothetical protein [Patescibacteria group bacterium]